MAAEPVDNADEVTKYLPHRVRSGLALCLSGGGFRAALFHLGAVRRLNELGSLATLDSVSSVSGGSILAAHLATCLRPGPSRLAICARLPSRDVSGPGTGSAAARASRRWPRPTPGG
jgi:hypothetical protein